MELFPVTLPADTFRSTKLRLEPVIGDAMEPTLRGGHDFVLVAPVHEYQHEGLYLVGGHTDYKAIVRCDAICGRRQIRIMRDNPVFRGEVRLVDLEAFNSMVLGIVVADVKVRADHVLRDVLEGRAA